MNANILAGPLINATGTILAAVSTGSALHDWSRIFTICICFVHMSENVSEHLYMQVYMHVYTHGMPTCVILSD